MSDEDRAVATSTAATLSTRPARDGSPYRLRLVAHDPSAYDGFYNVVANPTLWFLQHYMWGLPYAPDLDLGLHNAWFNGYLPVNEGFASATIAELDREPDAAVFFHDYHLYLAPKLVREQRPDALLAHFIHIPWPETDYWHVLPEHLRRAVHEGVLANDILGLHTRALEAQLPPRVRGRPRRRRRLTRRRRSCTTAGDARHESPDRRSTRPSSKSCATTRRVLEQERADRRASAGVPRRARRPHGSVEERRARLSRVRALPRPASGDARPRDAARAARPVAAGHPGVHRVSRRDRARGAQRQRPLPARGLAAGRPAGRRQLRAVDRGVQAVRRAARERRSSTGSTSCRRRRRS